LSIRAEISDVTRQQEFARELTSHLFVAVLNLEFASGAMLNCVGGVIPLDAQLIAPDIDRLQ
jgi:hypothetical protein